MDLCIRVDFLTGRYIATDAFNRAGHEWPAHPNRLFSASVAALHDGDEADQEEREALQWLETLGDPSILASGADTRTVSTHFVPTNDASIASAPQVANRYSQLDQAFEALAAAPTEAKRQSALKKIDKARDVTKMLAWDEKTSATDILPEERIKQARFYPSVTPEEPTQWFIWNGVDEKLYGMHQTALQRVLGRIARLGHSSSFVLVSLDQCDEDANWVPDRSGAHTLRTIAPGQLDQLEREFNERAVHALQSEEGIEHFSDISPRIMPNRLTAYRFVDGQLPSQSERLHTSLEHGEWMPFEYVQGKRFTVTQTWEVCRAFRSALLKFAPDSTSPYLSGHEADGKPTSKPHIKVLAPSYVAGKYANGIGMGIVLLLPHSDDEEDKLNVYRAIANWEKSCNPDEGSGPISLFTTGGSEVMFQRTLRPGRKTMVAETWTKQARLWRTATPIALDRNPKFFGHANTDKHEKAIQRIIAGIEQACRDQGLPIPESIDISRRPYLRESFDAKVFGRVNIGGLDRFLIHAQILFPEPVEGPLVLGAGRFFGMGLCLPGRG